MRTRKKRPEDFSPKALSSRTGTFAPEISFFMEETRLAFSPYARDPIGSQGFNTIGSCS